MIRGNRLKWMSPCHSFNEKRSNLTKINKFLFYLQQFVTIIRNIKILIADKKSKNMFRKFLHFSLQKDKKNFIVFLRKKKNVFHCSITLYYHLLSKLIKLTYIRTKVSNPKASSNFFVSFLICFQLPIIFYIGFSLNY